MKQLIILPLVLLGACSHKPVTVEKPVVVHVEKPMPCPQESELDKLLTDRPTPLRSSPMPESDVVRVARSEAQLGKYEAEGGWADKVTSALKRCRNQ